MFTLRPAKPTEITAENFLRVASELQPGESIVTERMENGNLRFSIRTTRGDKRDKTFLANRMEARLHPLPLSSLWMPGSLLDEPTERVIAERKARNKETKAKTKEKASEKELLLANLKLAIALADSESKFSTGFDKYTMYKSGNTDILVSVAGTIARYRVCEGNWITL